MDKITLFSLSAPGINISMELYFNEKNQLYFDGYDVGKSVDAAWGDPDYEYTYTIEPEDVNNLYPIFNLKIGDRAGLLQCIKDRFEGNKAYSLFGEFMTANNIKFESFTWS